MWHQESGFSVTHRVAQSRTIRCERGGGACRRFDDSDAPAFLGRREDIGPGAAHQVDLAFFTDEAVKDDGAIEAELRYQRFELRAIVTGTRNLEAEVRT